MTLDDKIKVLEITIKEEQYFLTEHQVRIQFFTGLISTVVTLTIAGIFQAKINLHYLALLIGPFLIFTLAYYGIKSSFRMYQRYFEAITIRAKLEQSIGFSKTISSENNENIYWENESLISYRHLQARMKFDTSEAFITFYSKQRYQNLANKLFNLFIFTSLILCVTILYIVITNTTP